jgi:hypothetical protein
MHTSIVQLLVRCLIGKQKAEIYPWKNGVLVFNIFRFMGEE